MSNLPQKKSQDKNSGSTRFCHNIIIQQKTENNFSFLENRSLCMLGKMSYLFGKRKFDRVHNIHKLSAKGFVRAFYPDKGEYGYISFVR
jgi:hypothetical protein